MSTEGLFFQVKFISRGYILTHTGDFARSGRKRIFEYSVFPRSSYMKDYSDSFKLGELVSCSIVPQGNPMVGTLMVHI